LPLHKDFRKVNVQTETTDENSILNAYRQLITLRKATPTLQCGEIDFTETGRNEILSFTRTLNDRQTLTILNFSSHKRRFPCMVQDGFWLAFSTHRNSVAENEEIVLYPFEAVVLVK